MTLFLFKLAVFAAVTSPLFGQAVTGSIQGNVSDESGGRVPGTAITITSTRTRATRTATADGQGRYAVPSVEAGVYELRAEKTGFRPSVIEGIGLAVNQVAVVDLALKVGPVQEAVRVAAATEALESQNATISGLVDSRRVIDLPLNGRNFSQLVNLQAGVAIINGQGLLGGGSDSSGIQGSGQFVNGARGTNNSFLFDGGDANDPVAPSGTGSASTAAFVGGAPGVNGISVDAVQEFRVITSGASAEFGRSSGAIINVITKSGGNELHGSLFHFLRNRSLNARDTFEPRKPGFTQNNFGGTFGGPLRKDSTFYFFSYEGFRQRQAVSLLNQVPSPNTITAVRRQNALLGAIFGAYFSGPGAALPGTFTERPVEAILADGTPVIGSVVSQRGNGVDQNALLYRIDHNLPHGGRLSGRHQFFDAAGLPGTISGTGIPGSNVGYTNRSQNVVLAHTQPFGPHNLNEARGVFQRNSPQATFEPTPQALLDTGRLRTEGAYAGQPYGPPDTDNGLPTITTPGFGITLVGYDTTAPNRRGVNTFQVSDTFTRASGGHTLKAGFDLRRIQENSIASFRLRPDVSYASGGNSSILLPGSPVLSYDQNLYLTPPTSQRGFRLTEWAWFAQDNWRATRNLTLDLGLRYEYYGRPYEVNGYLNNGFLAPGGTPLPGINTMSQGPAALRDLRLRTVGPGRPLDFFAADRNNFAPRVGLAWRPGMRGLESSVVRAGYGIFYDRLFNNTFGNSRISPPFTLPVNLPVAPFGALPVADPFTTTLPIAPVTVNAALRSPYTQRFHISIQREFPGAGLAEIGYVGARALHVIRTLRPNQGAGFPTEFRPSNVDVVPRPNSIDDFRPINFGNVFLRDSSGASTYHSLQASLQRRFAGGLFLQASYTFAQSTDLASGEILTDVVVTTISNTLPLRTADGRVPLPSLDLVNQVRQQRGLAQFTGAGATLAAARYYNENFLGPGQLRADIGNSAFDVRQIFVANFGYELPVGRGKRFGPGWPSVAQALFAGWQISGVVRVQSGIPITLSSGVDANGDGNAPDRAAVLAGRLDALYLAGGGKGGSRQFFAASTPGRGPNNQATRVFVDGTVIGVSNTPADVSSYTSRGALHGPPLRLADIALFKRFQPREPVSAQIRAEFFNLLNLTNLAAPLANMASPLFGQSLGTSAPPRQIQLALRLDF